MQKRQQQQEQNSNEWRLKIIKWFSLPVSTYSLPFFKLQLLLQIIFHLQLLKFSIDYFPHAWFASPQPFFLYLDLGYYFNFISADVFFDFLIVFLVAINLYWMLPFLMHLYGIEKSNTMANLTKALFLVMKNILLLPTFNLLLNLFNCSADVRFRKCFEKYSLSFLFVFILSFAAFFACLLGQTYLDFQFLPRDKTEVRMRRSGITSCLWMVYALANQLNDYFLGENAQLAVLNLSTVGLLVAVILTDDEVHEGIKLMQCGFIGVQLLGALFVDVRMVLSPGLPPFLFALLAPLLFLAIMQLKTTNLRFQLENINKWPTPEIMISYAAKLRHYLALREDYSHLVYLHGYMEIHRQKCDNPNCPSRSELPEPDCKLLESGAVPSSHEQLLRCENIIKNIYSDGYRLAPISPELQLQNATFLYQRGERELALRSLMLMKPDRLSLDKFYRLQVLKEKIHGELNQPGNQFLDLVSETLVKREEQLLMQRFESSALINLEFWSLLNDDHPDFQKLNEVALARIRIRQEIRENYGRICRIAHSERVTACYANYLESIENDEHMFNEIYSSIKQKYQLEERVTLQDWANSSSNVMLVSVEDSSFGTIVYVNTSCATALGYQKFQLQNHSLRTLFPEELKNEIKDFLGERTNGQPFLLCHKSGYLMRVGKQAQTYNSMETGMTAILTLQPLLDPRSCAFLLDRNSRVAGVTPSIVPLLGVDLRAIQAQATAGHIFLGDVETLKKMGKDKERSYLLRELVKRQFYDSEQRANSLFKISFTEQSKLSILELKEVIRGRNTYGEQCCVAYDFQFRVQGSVGFFKYIGAPRSQGGQSKFTKLQAKYEEEQNQESIYSKGITTLRLRNKAIQIIQEEYIEDLNEQNGRQGEDSSERLILPRRDEEEIFESKDRLQKFVSEYRIASHMLATIAVGLLGVVAMQAGYYSVYLSQSRTIGQLSAQLAMQHLINGAVTKQQCLLAGLQLAAKGKSQQSGAHFLSLYKDNLQYLQSIELMGLAPFRLALTIDSQATNILTRQFLLSMINSANQLAVALTAKASAAQMWNSFSAMDLYAQSYLTSATATAKQLMYSRSLSREKEVGAWLQSAMKDEAVMLSMGVIYLFLFTILAFFVIHRINLERIDIFDIFLQISDTKIQQFSNRTQKLLISLHVQEASDETDDDNDKKVSSSTFSKKKSFKQVSFSKAIYLKVFLVPLFFLGYFIHSYAVTNQFLTFQRDAIPYFRLSAAADYILYSDFDQIFTGFLEPASPPDGLELATAIRLYYREYFVAHYDSFGYVPDFHKAWNSLFFLDICQGSATPFGSTYIAESCLLGGLSDNGTYMVVSDIIIDIKSIKFSEPLSASLHHEYQTLSKSHRLITNMLLQAQKLLTDRFARSILQVLLVWVLCGLALIFLWGIPMTRSFVLQINEIKNIISILPVSLARQLPNARRYFHKILQQNGNC